LLVTEVLQLHDGVIKVGVESCYKSHLSCIAWSQGCISVTPQVFGRVN
jgi:hypothetical protein